MIVRLSLLLPRADLKKSSYFYMGKIFQNYYWGGFRILMMIRCCVFAGVRVGVRVTGVGQCIIDDNLFFIYCWRGGIRE